eukprot:CAMPEP_0167780140 /NCGR_PEP_ID=MMETSP0111_2-20121227/5191_1 /TAXON_ID=91324 /ORGANISM="Lotharella globosa, Strain CCCM811" /LENGTH=131 /DNA_ID=CAMNT_0007670617 /DNA_START=178 /DNA_END=573 /DNA_ORIENTATION=-
MDDDKFQWERLCFVGAATGEFSSDAAKTVGVHRVLARSRLAADALLHFGVNQIVEHAAPGTVEVDAPNVRSRSTRGVIPVRALDRASVVRFQGLDQPSASCNAVGSDKFDASPAFDYCCSERDAHGIAKKV